MMMRSVRLLMAAATLPRGALGQITGAECKQVPGSSSTDPKLCIPQFCQAPDQIRRIHPPVGQSEYIFTANNSHGVQHRTSFMPSTNLHGYDLEQICGAPYIQLAHPIVQCQGADCPPSAPPPPLYSSHPPRGCAAISPLPTLLQQLDLDLVAVWILLIAYLFFALAMVCEEFLVPAINILCVKTGIPDDVAGATLLAAGCNSPEFFASIIGIFVADSTVGVGTVIGSAPFNLCCITGGAALAVGGSLYVDPWLMARELFGLLSAFALFLTFMDDYRIEWWEALTMVVFYCCIYVPLLAHFDTVKRSLLRCVGAGTSSDGSTLMIDDPDHLAFTVASRGTSEPFPDASGAAADAAFGGGVRGAIAASISTSLARSLVGTQRVTFGISDLKLASVRAQSIRDLAQPHVSEHMSVELQPVGGPRPGVAADAERGGLGGGRTSLNPSKPTLDVLVEACKRRCEAYPDAENGFRGVLMKKPRGLTKVRVRGILWQARYFVLDHHPTNPLRYSHANQKTKFVTLPLQHVSHIELVGAEEIQLTTPNELYKLRLPVGEPKETMQRWFDQIVVKIDEMGFAPPPPTELLGEGADEGDHEHHGPWWEMPESTSAMVLHVLTFPLKALVFTTTPNVLLKKNEKYFPLTIGISMIWLAFFATLMTDIIEYLGCGIGVDGTVMGLSLGAIGTSFPNLYASILVARAGQGGMAICQAIASNTFNICICLALLWLIHTLGLGGCDYGSHGALHASCGGCYAPSGFKPLCPYWEGTNNKFGTAPGSTKGAVLVSLVWVVGFIATLMFSNMHIRKGPAMCMFLLYALYIIYQFAAAMGAPITICFSKLNICI